MKSLKKASFWVNWCVFLVNSLGKNKDFAETLVRYLRRHRPNEQITLDRLLFTVDADALFGHVASSLESIVVLFWMTQVNGSTVISCYLVMVQGSMAVVELGEIIEEYMFSIQCWVNCTPRGDRMNWSQRENFISDSIHWQIMNTSATM